MMTDDGRTARRHDRRGPDLRCRMGRPAATRASHDLATPEAAWTAGTLPEAGAEPLLTAEVVRAEGEVAVVAVTGEIDVQTAGLLRDRLLELAESGHRTLVADFAEVLFCDAAGLSALVAAHNRVASDGGALRLARVRPAQRKLLRVTGLHRVFPLYDDLDNAAGGLDNAAGGLDDATGGPSAEAAFPGA